MRRSWLFSAWQRIFIAGTLFAVPLVSTPQRIQALGSGEVAAIINVQRANNGLPPLNYSAQLNSSATSRAQHMLALGYWGHIAPDGMTLAAFVGQTGYAYTALGENLARDTGSSGQTVSMWMASPMHRSNILNAGFSDIGVGVASGSMNGVPATLIVAHFGASVSRPAPAPAPAPAPKPVPASAPAPSVPQPVHALPAATVASAPAGQPKSSEEPAEPKPSLSQILTSLEDFASSPVIKLIEAKKT